MVIYLVVVSFNVHISVAISWFVKVSKYSISCRWKGESLQESIKRHEHFLALQLCVEPGMKVCLIFLSIMLINYFHILMHFCSWCMEFNFFLGCRCWTLVVVSVDHFEKLLDSGNLVSESTFRIQNSSSSLYLVCSDDNIYLEMNYFWENVWIVFYIN